MFRKLALTALGAFALFGVETVTASPAEAMVRCVAAAERINGARVPGTRTAIDRFREFRACNIALRVCDNKLNEARHFTGRPMPFARCNVVRVRNVGHGGFRGHGPYGGPPPRHGQFSGHPHGHHGGHPQGHQSGPGYCNFSACNHRYRSFRASDCTFQPYHGPRKHCAL